MNFIPVNGWILCEPVQKVEAKTTGGIVIPEKNPSIFIGRIVAVSQNVPAEYAVGSFVFFSEMPKLLRLDDAKEYILVHQALIMGTMPAGDYAVTLVDIASIPKPLAGPQLLVPPGARRVEMVQ